jgi:hypothetical protein
MVPSDIRGHQFQVPCRLGPTEHQQRVVAVGVGHRAVEHLEAEAVNPEPFGAREVRDGRAMRRWLDAFGRMTEG